MDKKFTYEHWEAHDEYIILYKGPIGYTVNKKDADVITKWLNSVYPELINRMNISEIWDGEYRFSGGE